MLTALRLLATFTVFLPCFVLAALCDGTALGRQAERVVHFVLSSR